MAFLIIMGNILSNKLKDLLTEYTYNFTTKNISLQILKGEFGIESLLINETKVNDILQKAGLPIRLKFGLLKKFSLKLSVLSAKLEHLIVDDLILIFGPADKENEKFEGAEEIQIYNMVLKNMLAEQRKNPREAKYLDPNLFAEVVSERIKKMKEDKEKAEKAAQESEKKKKNAKPANPKEQLNILGIEMFELIKNLLDCTIKIQKIYIIYEDNLPHLLSNESLESVILMISFRQFAFSNKEITHDTDKKGIFKNFMNVSQFLQKSGTWSLSDTAYWNITFEKFEINGC